MQEEIDVLSSEVARLEDELASAHDEIEAMKRDAAKKEHSLYVSGNASINKIFSAIPVRCASLESGRIVIHTHDESGRSLAKLSTADEIEETQKQIIAPNVTPGQGSSGAGEKKRLFGTRRSVPPGPGQQQQQQQHRGSGSTVRVFRLDETSNAGVVCVAVRFRMDYGPSAPRVTVMTQIHGVNVVSTVQGKTIKTTPAGFAFELRQKDLGAAHNMVVNWIAVTDPPKNPALQTLLETILAQNSGTDGESTSSSSSSTNAELEKAVSKFVHANGTEAADTNGQTLLHASASAGNERLVRYLLGKGARLNAVDEHGWTALLCAVSAGHLGLALELLESGADGTVVTESGSNGLHYLARWPGKTDKYKELLKGLLDAGCDPNGYNNDGDTAVNVFCQRDGSAETVELLLERGGSVSVANQHGYSPLHAAVANDSVDLVRLLCKHGADPNFVASADVGSPYAMALAQKRTKILAVFSAAAAAEQHGTVAARLPGRYHVKIVEARNLARVCDAYCVLENSGHAHRTPVACHTSRPHWDQRVVLESPAGHTLRLSVWSFSLTKSCTLLGRAALDLARLGAARVDVWLPLRSAYADSECAGSAAATSSISSSMGTPAAAPDAPARPELHVVVHHHVEDVRRRLRATTRVRAMDQLLQPASPRTALMSGALGTLAGSAALASQVQQQQACGGGGGGGEDAFVSWQFPRAEWAEPRSVAGCAWCVDAASCVEHGYSVEASPAAVAPRSSEGNSSSSSSSTSTPFDHHACERHYARTLAPRPHSTVYAVVWQQPVVASVEDAPPDRPRQVIVRTSKEDVRTVVPPAPSAVAAVQALALATLGAPDARAEWACAHSAAAVAALVRYEQLVTVATYRFGVLYAGPGDRTEAQLFARRAGSAAYERFLDSLGRRVALRGWDGFRGCLDVRNDETGRESLYTRYGTGDPQLEIMFHVATMLPYRAGDPQQIERKRHIGNDVCVLIYKDSTGPDDTVDIASFVSHFNNVFVVVSPVPDAPGMLRVAVAAKQCTRPFPPFVPATGNVFSEGPALRQWLLEKLINGERMTMETPDYRSRLMNPRKVLLMDVIRQCQQSP